ncbi:hypothetical protein IM774_08945 [Erysipelotrichaceae bacterium RD49]|nr:hypothetical protein [Erysipelotrichaceae bacterium RD49]
MNTRNLQIHLENRLSSLASACVNHNAVDDGLIFEILASDSLSDESRLHYICQIECRLSSASKVRQKSNVDLNSFYCEEEEVRCEKQRRWNELHQIAVELRLNKSEHREQPRESFYRMVSVLTIDPKDAGMTNDYSNLV